MTGRLPDWLGDWLKIDAPGVGDSAAWRLESVWNWPLSATLLLFALMLLWVVVWYARESAPVARWRRVLLAALRVGALLILMVMIARWALELRLTEAPALGIVIDRSASMGIQDHDPGTDASGEQPRSEPLGVASRLDLAKLLLTRGDGHLLEELRRRYRLEVYFVDGAIERYSGPGDGDELREAIGALRADGPGSGASRLGDGVERVLDDARGTEPAGIVLLSDGNTTEGRQLDDVATEARRRGVPIFAVGLGNDQAPRDLELVDLVADDVVFVNDLVSFEARIKSSGLGGETVRIVLRREGDPEPVAEQELTLAQSGELQTVHLIDRVSEVGDVAYVVQVVPRDDEINQENNSLRRTVSVRDDAIRVLLAAGYPSYEFRFLKSLLERDATIDLATYLQEADPDYAEQDRTALRSLAFGRDELFEYDVLILGDMDPRLLPRSFWENLQAFVVEQGGGVAMLAGPRYFPWLYRDLDEVATLVPIDLAALIKPTEGTLSGEISEGFVALPTALGLQAPALQLGDSAEQTSSIWRSLAPLYWLVEVDKLKAGAQVLVEHPGLRDASGRNLPVVVFQYVGAGRVLFHAIDSTWRWRIGEGDPYYARYWVQSIRQLARGALGERGGAELRTDRREYRYGEPVELRARLLDSGGTSTGETASVLLRSPDQANRMVTLHRGPAGGNRFEAVVTDLASGRYEAILVEPRLSDRSLATHFSVVAPPGELAQTEMNRAALVSAVERTGGQFYTFEEGDRLVDELPTGRRAAIKNLPSVPIWNQWWVLVMFLALLTGEWILRKRAGML